MKTSGKVNKFAIDFTVKTTRLQYPLSNLMRLEYNRYIGSQVQSFHLIAIYLKVSTRVMRLGTRRFMLQLSTSLFGAPWHMAIFDHPYSFPLHHRPPAYRFFCWDSLSTFLTIFCSSIRKARTTRSLTQLAHLEPGFVKWCAFHPHSVYN
jgi:hypothetical protein